MGYVYVWMEYNEAEYIGLLWGRGVVDVEYGVCVCKRLKTTNSDDRVVVDGCLYRYE